MSPQNQNQQASAYPLFHNTPSPNLLSPLQSRYVDGTLTSTTSNASTSESGTDALFGIGVNISITDSLSACIEAERFKFDNDDLDFISIGIQYNF